MRVPKLEELNAVHVGTARGRIGYTCRELRRQLVTVTDPHAVRRLERDLDLAEALRLVFEEATLER